MTQPPDPGDPFAPPPAGPPALPPTTPPAWGPPPPQPAWRSSGEWQQPACGQPPWTETRKTNVLAILSLVFAFLCFPVAIVLGIIALVQLRGSSDGGRGLAIAGLAVSAVWTALTLLVVGLGIAGTFDSDVYTGTVAQAGTTTVGTCMLSSQEAAPNRAVPCDEPHDQEVYLVGTLPSGDYPGDARVEDLADGMCLTGFRSYVGVSYYDSDHDYSFYAPDSDEWVDEEERRVVCVLTPAFGDRDYDSAYRKGD